MPFRVQFRELTIKIVQVAQKMGTKMPQKVTINSSVSPFFEPKYEQKTTNILSREYAEIQFA